MAKKDKKTSGQEKESFFGEITNRFRQSPALYIGSVVILVLVVVTFIGGDLLSGGGFGRDAGDLTFGYYDKAPISFIPGNQFAQYYDNISRHYQSQGVNVGDFMSSFQIWRQAYDMALVHTAVLRILNRSNYAVPERIVDRAVAALPHFQENGRFSPALYRQAPEVTRLALWRQEQERLATTMFFNDTFNLLSSAGEVNFIAGMNSPLRSFDMVSFNAEDYPESGYLSFAQENSRLFNSMHLSKITFGSSEREARRILSSIQDGTITFEDAARNHSQDHFSDRGGDTGSRYLFEIDPEIPNSADREAVYRLRSGELSGLVPINDGWVLYRAENSLTQADFTDESVMERVRTHVKSVHRGRLEDWALAQARDFISDAMESDFDSAAQVWNLEKLGFGPIPVNFGSLDLFYSIESFAISGFTSQDLQSLSNNENFWRIAFSTALNSLSEPLIQGNNIIVLLPTGQTEADENMINNLVNYFPYWIKRTIEQNLHTYFINSDKMDDRFWDIFFKNFF